MNREQLVSLLERLVMAHSPSGHEGEVSELIQEEFGKRSERVWEDPMGNIVCLVEGRSTDRPTILTAHMDEIGMIVKRIEDGGKLRLRMLGGSVPWKYGEGPVDILGDHGVVTGVLSFGSRHITKESATAWAARTEKPLDWDMVWVETMLSREELSEKGVHIGSKVAMGRARKKPVLMGEYIGAYGLDCKGGVAILMMLAESLEHTRPAHDVYLVATREEEVGCLGAAYVARQLPAETMIALEVGVVAEEFQVENSDVPIIYHADASATYDEDLNGQLAALAGEQGIEVQHALLQGGTDAGKARHSGMVARGTAVGFATENTHGYEISSLGGIENLAKILEIYLTRG